MFYPEHRKNFNFFITSELSDEKIKLDIDDLSKLMNNYELPLRERKNLNSLPIARSVDRDMNITERNKSESKVNKRRRDGNPKLISPERESKKISQILMKNTSHEKMEKRMNFSVQMLNLNGYLKFSKLIFVTPYIYIRNTISKNLYILFFHTKDKNKISVDLLKPGTTKKLYYLKDYFEIFKLSFDDKFHVEEMNLYSGMVKFVPNTEFYIKVGDK